MTPPTRDVLQALLSDPTCEYYGLELSKISGIPHGTMYGILIRLERWGWLTNRLEYAPDRASPPRRYYRLTGYGAQEATRALARAEARVRAPSWLKAAPGGAT